MQLKLSVVLACFVGFGLLNGCSVCPDAKEPNIYVGIQSNSKEESDFAKKFLLQLSRTIDSDNLIHIDQLKADTFYRPYSSPADRRAISAIVRDIDVQESSDQSIVQFFQNLKDLASASESSGSDLYAYLLSNGTSNSETLSQISEIVSKMELEGLDRVQLYLIGSSDNRIIMSNSLSVLEGRVNATNSLYGEWQNAVNAHSVSCSIDE